MGMYIFFYQILCNISYVEHTLMYTASVKCLVLYVICNTRSWILQMLHGSRTFKMGYPFQYFEELLEWSDLPRVIQFDDLPVSKPLGGASRQSVAGLKSTVCSFCCQ